MSAVLRDSLLNSPLMSRSSTHSLSLWSLRLTRARSKRRLVRRLVAGPAHVEVRSECFRLLTGMTRRTRTGWRSNRIACVVKSSGSSSALLRVHCMLSLALRVDAASMRREGQALLARRELLDEPHALPVRHAAIRQRVRPATVTAQVHQAHQVIQIPTDKEDMASSCPSRRSLPLILML